MRSRLYLARNLLRTSRRVGDESEAEAEKYVSEQISLIRKWSIEGFTAFWSNPDPAVVPRVLEGCTDDIVSHWPRPIGLLEGGASYLAVIEAILKVCPDLALTVKDHAHEGDLHFVRWVATGGGPERRFEFDGINLIRTVADGRVCENYVCSDGELFARVAGYLGSEGRSS
jgi:hypothetical protein